jgi:hypothetical protein
VNQGNYALILVRKVESAAIGDVNTQADIGLIGDQPIAASETVVAGKWGIDDPNLTPVNLFRGRECIIEEFQLASSLAVDVIQICEHEVFVVRQFYSRNASHEAVATTEALQRGKCFDR